MIKLIKENNDEQLKDIELFKRISELADRKAKGESSSELNKELRAYMRQAEERLATTNSSDMLEQLAEYGFSKFRKEDYYMWDAGKCSDGSLPLIYYNSENEYTEYTILLTDETIAVESITDLDNKAGDTEEHELSKDLNGIADAIRTAKMVVQAIKGTDSIEELSSVLNSKGFRNNM